MGTAVDLGRTAADTLLPSTRPNFYFVSKPMNPAIFERVNVPLSLLSVNAPASMSWEGNEHFENCSVPELTA